MFKDLIFELVGINRTVSTMMYMSNNVIVSMSLLSWSVSAGNITPNRLLDDFYGTTLPDIHQTKDIIDFEDFYIVHGNPENAKEYFKEDDNIIIFINHLFKDKRFFILSKKNFTEEQKVLFELGLDFYD